MAGLWDLAPIPAMIGLITTFYWLLVTGRLIPRSSHERELNQQKEQTTDWKTAAKEQKEINQEIRQQNSVLLETARITSKFFVDVDKNLDDTRTG